jgi:hypothetical protein
LSPRWDAFASATAAATPADLERRAPLDRVAHEALHDRELWREDHRADVDLSTSRIALSKRADDGNGARDERVVDLLVGVDTLDRGARLPPVREAAVHDRVRRLFDVGVGTGDEGRFASKLEHARNEARTARGADLLSDGDRSGENHPLDAAVDERFARLAVSDDDREEIFAHPGRVVDLLRLQHHEGSRLARLHDHRVPCNQSSNDGAERDDQGAVPRRNHADDPRGRVANDTAPMTKEVKRDVLVGERPRRLGGVIRHEIERDEDLVDERLLPRLARFERDEIDHLVRALEQRVAKAEETFGALFDGEHRPSGLRPLGARHRRRHFRRSRDPELGEQLTRRGRVRLHLPSRCGSVARFVHLAAPYRSHGGTVTRRVRSTRVKPVALVRRVAALATRRRSGIAAAELFAIKVIEATTVLARGMRHLPMPAPRGAERLALELAASQLRTLSAELGLGSASATAPDSAEAKLEALVAETLKLIDGALARSPELRERERAAASLPENAGDSSPPTKISF